MPWCKLSATHPFGSAQGRPFAKCAKDGVTSAVAVLAKGWATRHVISGAETFCGPMNHILSKGVGE